MLSGEAHRGFSQIKGFVSGFDVAFWQIIAACKHML